MNHAYTAVVIVLIFFSLHNKLETKIYQPSKCDESKYVLACLCQMIILNGRVNIVLQLEVFLIIY